MTRIFTLSLFLASAFLNFAQLPQVTLVQLAGSYASPIDIKSCGDNRLFVVEQKGIIRILYKDGTKQSTPFLDIDSRVNSVGDEEGLLGLAFSPAYKQNGFFYVQYTSDLGADSIIISRFNAMPGDSTQADPNSERILMTYYDPFSNHNGGSLAFGPDGYLYATQGDGGSANDPQGNGQNLNVWLGKVLRIDVSDTSGTYTVPGDNPFLGVPNAKPEIWAYGLRNPWRTSFDKITGDYWIADVGQNAYEEIDFQPANDTGGQNYGWNCREALHAFGGCSTPASNFTEPVAEIPHTNSVCSITGGYVYRGTQYNRLFGRYIFTDYCNSDIYSLLRTGVNAFDLDTLAVITNFQYYTSFGQDNLGELYVARRGSTSNPTGIIYKLVETSDCNPVAFITLKDTLEACSSVTLTALQGDTLSYQWYNSNGIVNGATTYEYKATQSGWYKVLVSKPLHAGCESFSDSVYANVLDTTQLLAFKFSALCSNGSTVQLSNYVTPTGGSFSGSNVGIGGSFNPATANIGSNSVLYEYTAANGCVSKMNFDMPVAEFTSITKSFPIATYCTTDAPFYIGGNFLPDSGVIAGTAVVNDTFNPALVLTPADAWVYYSITNEYGCVSTDSFQLAVSICNGLQNVSTEIGFSISPNPSNGNFKLDITSAEAANALLHITDATGKICFTKKLELRSEKTSLPLELQLAKGVYTVQLKSEKFTTVKNLVIE